ncbi:hypothetical protein B0O99DRAFT_627633 [Bisporella sp. PMI_857]|nr:hypothetical protein B0O99DRAFT_627633 [Bisporella sp. PMI_857]
MPHIQSPPLPFVARSSDQAAGLPRQSLPTAKQRLPTTTDELSTRATATKQAQEERGWWRFLRVSLLHTSHENHQLINTVVYLRRYAVAAPAKPAKSVANVALVCLMFLPRPPSAYLTWKNSVRLCRMRRRLLLRRLSQPSICECKLVAKRDTKYNQSRAKYGICGLVAGRKW